MRARYVLICAIAGVGVGTAMIITRIGPGIPPQQAGFTAASRNTQRVELIAQLTSGLEQYYKAHGSLPVAITSQDNQICTSVGANCISEHLVDLSFLTTGGDYITGIPHDPNGGDGLWGSGFDIAKLPDGNIRISAPEAELGKVIQTTFQL